MRVRLKGVNRVTKRLADGRTRGVFMAWRDRLAATSRRQADYAWQVLARVLSWAKGRGLVAANPCERGGRLYGETRAEKVWTADDESLTTHCKCRTLFPTTREIDPIDSMGCK